MNQPQDEPRASDPPDSEPRAFFRRRHRLTHARDFTAARRGTLVKRRGPLVFFCHPSTRPEHRLGLGVARHVGKAHVRVRAKRLLREAFRLERAGLPVPPEGGHYDIVVSVRPYRALTLALCRRYLREAVWAAHRDHLRRSEGEHG